MQTVLRKPIRQSRRSVRTCDFRVEQVVGSEIGAGASRGERLLSAQHLGAETVHQVLHRRQTLQGG